MTPCNLRRRSLGIFLLAGAVAPGLASCGDKKAGFTGIDVSGAPYGRSFRVIDHNGVTRTLASFHGKVVLLFFGYMQCPDVCPTALSSLAEVMRLLGPDSARVQVLFMTVDPERDSAELLKQYVPAFHPAFLGVRAEEGKTDEIVREFNAFYRKVPGKTPESYTIDHTALTYAFSPAGQMRLMMTHATSAERIAADIRELLAGN